MNTNPTKIILYYADWCKYCTEFKPQWFQFKNAYDLSQSYIKNKFKTELIIAEYENEMNSREVVEAAVKVFPTVHIIRNDNVETYKGDRTAIGLFKAAIPNMTMNDIQDVLNKISQTGGGSNYYKKKYMKYKMKYLAIKKN